ncbi:MAG TPA: hypothetical protein VEN81_06275 [Planctomycetota bacterium]|jgi:hypothetical protein|nr:hypothetical protein [Planctomycetota bacterium]
MPIDFRIDRRRKLVLAIPRGLLTHEEMVAYQKEVWTRPEVAGFDELIDMTFVDRLDLRSPDQIFELAALSAKLDLGQPPSRMAIVATDRLHVALGRMYRASREASPSHQREIEIFPTIEAARDWLRARPRSPAEKTPLRAAGPRASRRPGAPKGGRPASAGPLKGRRTRP